MDLVSTPHLSTVGCSLLIYAFLVVIVVLSELWFANKSKPKKEPEKETPNQGPEKETPNQGPEKETNQEPEKETNQEPEKETNQEPKKKPKKKPANFNIVVGRAVIAVVRAVIDLYTRWFGGN